MPQLEKMFRKHKRPVGGHWRMDETYIKLNGVWKYLYATAAKEDKVVDSLLTAKPTQPSLNHLATQAAWYNPPMWQVSPCTRL